LWQYVFLKWERCKVLDGSGDIPTSPPKPMDKSTFRCLANLKEIRLEKLAKGFFCENDNFEGVSIQRREARDEVHVQIYKASKEEGCYVK
jgi:hypothetical protein